MASNADGSKKQEEERKKGEEDVAALMGAPVAVAVLVLVVVGTRLNLVMDESDKSVVSTLWFWSLLAFGFHHSVLLGAISRRDNT